MKVFNFGTAELETPEEPAGYRISQAGIRPAIGAETMAGNLFVLPPGEAVCPYHWETDEEWLIVLAGHPIVRHRDGEDTLGPGDIVCFEKGPAGAHKVTGGADEARLMIISTRTYPNLAGYPDSDKIGYWTAPDGDEGMFRRSSKVGYYDGETA